MRNLIVKILFIIILCKTANGQVICIMCYYQNDSISQNVHNLLVNGSFEINTCMPNSNSSTFCPNSINYSCDIANWTCTGGGQNTYASMWDNNITYVPNGIRTVYFGNDFCQACNSLQPNDTSCLNNLSCTVTGVPSGYPVNGPAFGGTSGVSLSQTVNGLIPGNIYILEFWTGGEDQFAFHGPGLFGLDVGFGDTLLRCPPTAPQDTGKTFIVEFIATSSSHTIKFTNWGHICSDCTELILDNVRLYTAAELAPSVPLCATSLPPYVDFVASDTAWCDKKSCDFFDLSTNNPTSWQWYFPGGVPSSSNLQNPTGIYYPSSGFFDVTLIACNAAGCDTLTYSAYIHERAAPPQPIIIQSGDTLCVPAYPSYQWFDINDLSLVLSTNQCFVPTDTGHYFAFVTDTNGCQVASNTITITTGIDEINKNFSVKIIPNPVSTEFTIYVNKNESMDLILYDITSRKIFQQKIYGSTTVNAEQLSKGIYLYEVINKSGYISKGKIVKD